MIQLQFTVQPEGWIETLCLNDQANVKILGMRLQGPDMQVTHFVDIVSDKVSAADLLREIRKSSDVTASDVASIGSNRLVGAVTSCSCQVCSAILDTKTGYFIGPAVSGPDCQMSYKLFMSGDGIPRFLQALHAKGVVYKVSEISKLTSSRALTSKQEKVLKSALDMGYYDYPKQASTEDLAKASGIAPSTVSEILRRAERKIISEYFDKS